MRPALWLLSMAVLGVPLAAWADDVAGMTLAPDGQYINKANYPSELASRPLLLPPNMFEVGAALDGLDSNGTWTSAARLDATYGVAPHVNVGANARGNLSGFLGAGLFADYLWTGNFAGRLGADVSCGSTCSALTLDVSMGVPVKIKPGSIPLSFRALDNILDVYVPFTAGEQVSTEVAIPVSVQFNLFPVLGIDVGLKTILPLGDSRGQLQFSPSASVLFTSRPFDLGVAARYTLAPGAPVSQIPAVFTAEGFVRVRL